jgi:hypothetical protein
VSEVATYALAVFIRGAQALISVALQPWIGVQLALAQMPRRSERLLERGNKQAGVVSLCIRCFAILGFGDFIRTPTNMHAGWAAFFSWLRRRYAAYSFARLCHRLQFEA